MSFEEKCLDSAWKFSSATRTEAFERHSLLTQQGIILSYPANFQDASDFCRNLTVSILLLKVWNVECLQSQR